MSSYVDDFDEIDFESHVEKSIYLEGMYTIEELKKIIELTEEYDFERVEH